MWYIIVVDTGLAVFRVFNRFIAVKAYGIKHAVASVFIPPFASLRLIWGNTINFQHLMPGEHSFWKQEKSKLEQNYS